MFSVTKNSVAYIYIFIALFTLSLIAIIHAWVVGDLQPVRQSYLLLPSILLFLTIISLGLISPRFYFIFFVFQLVAFPSIINYIFPSVLLGLESDLTNTPYPFFTNIDLYLLFGILIGISNSNKKEFKSRKINFVLICLLVSFIINLISTPNNELFHLLFIGSYHIRFIILFYLLFNLFDIYEFEKELLISVILSVLFLLLEAAINTSLNGLDRLTSGTLALNTFGNIISGMGVALLFFLLYHPGKKFKIISLIGLVSCIIIVILTKNRSSFLALCITVPFIYIVQTKRPLKLISYFTLATILIVVALNLLPMRKMLSFLPYRVNVFNYTDKIHFDNGKIYLIPSLETNPLISRINLYKTSIKMIKENPITGVGVGRWNYLKKEYGYKENILLDSHNGILALLSQYGLVGLPFIYYLFFFPIKVWRKNRNNGSILSYFILINIVMLFCELTNAGIFKYQVASLMIFVTFICILTSKRMVME